MLRKIHHFCFYCYFSMTLFNQHDNRVGRACYGLSFFYAVVLNIILLLNDTYLIKWPISPLIIPTFTCLLMLYLHFIFKKYFKLRCAGIELVYKHKSKKKFIFIGVIFWLGSFLLLGFMGNYYANKRKFNLGKESMQNIFPDCRK